MTHLAGKNTLVIGGSRGIGAAIVRRLTAEGATVAFTFAGSHEAAQDLAHETHARPIQSDASDRNAVIDTVAGCGELDILVVNAGAFHAGDALELAADEVDRMINVNVRAPYFAAVEAARRMPRGGRIIVIGSTNADRIPFAGAAAYALTKSALQGMARGLARDFGSREITINVVQPGPVDTEMNPADGPMADLMHSFMALKRHGHASEIAGLVAYLTSSDAAFVTGSMLTIDGGFAC